MLSEQIEKLKVNSPDDVFLSIEDNILRSENTMTNDWTDAKFVIAKSSQGSCLWSDLDKFISMGRKPDFITPSGIRSFEGYRESQGYKSDEALRLQRMCFIIPRMKTMTKLIN